MPTVEEVETKLRKYIAEGLAEGWKFCTGTLRGNYNSKTCCLLGMVVYDQPDNTADFFINLYRIAAGRLGFSTQANSSFRELYLGFDSPRLYKESKEEPFGALAAKLREEFYPT